MHFLRKAISSLCSRCLPNFLCPITPITQIRQLKMDHVKITDHRPFKLISSQWLSNSQADVRFCNTTYEALWMLSVIMNHSDLVFLEKCLQCSLNSLFSKQKLWDLPVTNSRKRNYNYPSTVFLSQLPCKKFSKSTWISGLCDIFDLFEIPLE